jgi:hypothetical protein
VVCVRLSRHIPGHYLKLGHDRFLPNPLQFIIYLNILPLKCTERVGEAVSLYTRFREALGSNLAILSEAFRSFPHSLQANARIVPQLGHDCFLPNPFDFAIQVPSNHPTLHSLGTVNQGGQIKGIKIYMTEITRRPRRRWTGRELLSRQRK